MTCTCSSLSPFKWSAYREPSQFVTDPAFAGNKAGKTRSQASTDAVDRYTARTGRNPGSVQGLSSHGDRLIEQQIHDRRAARA